jgi:hypothetical protein
MILGRHPHGVALRLAEIENFGGISCDDYIVELTAGSDAFIDTGNQGAPAYFSQHFARQAGRSQPSRDHSKSFHRTVSVERCLGGWQVSP